MSSPPPELARFVDAFWRFDGLGKPHRVVPDGCIDFLFELDSGRARVVGTMSRAEIVEIAPGSSIFGVRFLPGAASALLEAHARELADHEVSLDEVTKGRRLAERVAEAQTDVERRAILIQFLRDPRSRVRPVDWRVQRAAALIARQHGSAPLPGVADAVGVGERQLERLFLERVGVQPKLFARIARVERAMRLVESGPRALADIAANAGFSDESHLLRDFRALVGVTPRELRVERHVGFVQSAAPRSA